MSGRAIFLGSKPFGLAILRALMTAEVDLAWSVIHPADDKDSRSALGDFKRYCAQSGIDFTVTQGAREAYSAIESANADVVFVCGWYFLIPGEMLSGRARFFGIHNSLLPKYRGGAPLVWAIIRGEPLVGSTLFRITPGMDDGPVYLQVSAEMGQDDDIAAALAALEASFLAALPGAWPAIVSGANPGRPQDHSAATYCGQRIPEDGFIDWGRSGQEVHAFVRAQTRPYPGAFTVAPAGMVRVWKTRTLATPYYGTAGQVLERREDAIIIACGRDSAIAIVQAENTDGETRLMRLFPSLSLRLGQAKPL